MSVGERVLNAFVSEELHDVDDVPCAVVLHGGFPVAEGVIGLCDVLGLTSLKRHIDS